MNSVDRQRNVHCAARVVKVRLDVNDELLPPNVFVNLLQLAVPIGVGIGTEGVYSTFNELTKQKCIILKGIL